MPRRSCASGGSPSRSSSWCCGCSAGTLLPFLLGAGIAYFLDPIADRLQRLGMSRIVATSVIAVVGVLVLVAILVFAVPALIWQVQALVVALPEYIANLSAILGAALPGALRRELAGCCAT